ncbi:hypothetical protein Cni_G14027 [Canna indica]|uniref:Uncharacterized protein n=1 Tax=Canna indica TaxID=4628 RepID=A0AAQ3KC80_9LILI|nr:hypothetical protein Cni_G14027 [Canna indica]
MAECGTMDVRGLEEGDSPRNRRSEAVRCGKNSRIVAVCGQQSSQACSGEGASVASLQWGGSADRRIGWGGRDWKGSGEDGTRDRRMRVGFV